LVEKRAEKEKKEKGAQTK